MWSKAVAGALILIMTLPMLLYAQAMGIDVAVVDQNGVVKTSFNIGDEVRLKITPRQSPYMGVIAVTLVDPNGVATQPITPVNLCNGVYTEQTVRILKIEPQTPQGEYTVYVTEFDCAGNQKGQDQRQFRVGAGGSAQPILPPPSPAPDYTPLIIAAVVAVVMVAVAAAVAMRRRREEERITPPPPTYPPPPPPSPPPAPAAPPPGSVSASAPPATAPPSSPGGTAVLPRAGGTAVLPPSQRTAVAGGTMVGTPFAYLDLPNGQSIPIVSTSREFGRDDFVNFISRDVAQFISSRHFRIYHIGGQWYVEDLGSTNGTQVDGQEIKGRGPVPIRNGSVISPAGVVKLTFRIA